MKLYEISGAYLVSKLREIKHGLSEVPRNQYTTLWDGQPPKGFGYAEQSFHGKDGVINHAFHLATFSTKVIVQHILL